MAFDTVVITILIANTQKAACRIYARSGAVSRLGISSTTPVLTLLEIRQALVLLPMARS